jgi:uncharacterized protein
MFIRVQELELRRVYFDEGCQPEEMNLGDGVRLKEPAHIKGHAELIREHDGRVTVEDIRLVGKIQGVIESPCARCLEPVGTKVSRSFDFLYRPLEESGKSGEVELGEADTEIGFYSGEGLALEDAMRELLLLSLPVRILCQAECKGLCPHCGGNLNRESCGCKSTETDGRWNALKDLRKHMS